MFSFLPLVGKRSGRIVLGTILCLAISAAVFSTPSWADDVKKPEASRVEAPSADAAAADVKKTNVEKPETTVADAKKPDATVADAKKPETTVADAKKTDAKKDDATKTGDVKADASKGATKKEAPKEDKSPIVTTGDLSGLQSDQVKIHFNVSSKGDKKNLRVVVYYGTKDGGVEPTEWDKNTGPIPPDEMKDDEKLDKYTVTLPGLKPETNYFYRVCAKNNAGTKWSDRGAFETTPSGLPWYKSLAIFVGILAAFILPFWIGGRLAKGIRMPEQGWRLGVIFCSLTFAIIIIIAAGGKPQLGIDLSGGVIMIYDVDWEATAKAHPQEDQESADPKENYSKKIDKQIGALVKRINPGGEKTLTIRQRGEQIEITIPKADEQQVKRIKDRISEAGTLEFRILANPNNEEQKELIDLAMARQEEMSDPPSEIRDENRKLLGWWNPVDPKREDEFGYMRDNDIIATRVSNVGGVPRLEVLIVNDKYDVTGEYLSRCSVGADSFGRPAVHFNFGAQGAALFGELTGEFRPVEGARPYKYQLGIILNGDLYSAPSINDRITSSGIISGDFDNEKAQDLVNVLNAGSLPLILEKEPSNEWDMGPTLGADMVKRGAISIVASVLLVLIFMAIYYGFAGVVACGALLMNMILLFGIMIGIHADFTLAGIAGLVLTVGMAVDANVLIFERIREELDRGAALRMAIRNGFSKATTTIVDANMTTLITAIILFVIGTQDIRGFAVVLFLGITLSMFTAIFCARVVFDIAERRRFISKLSMRRILGKTNIDFVSKQKIGVACSIIVIAIGLVAVFSRGKGVLDIDFTGGESVTIVFKESRSIGDVRKELTEKLDLPDMTVNNVSPTDATEDTWYIINTSLKAKEGENAKKVLEGKLRDFYGDKLQTQVLEEECVVVPLDAEGKRIVPEEKASPGKETPVVGEKPKDAKPTTTSSGGSTDVADEEISSTGGTESNEEKKSTDPGKESAKDEQTDTPKTPGEKTSKSKVSLYANGSEAALVFGQTFDHKSVEEMIKEALKKWEDPNVEFMLTNSEYTGEDDERGYKKWTLRIALPSDKVQGAVITPLEEILHQHPIFPASSHIGGKVASDFRMSGIMAILASLICIVAYIWIRFQRVVFGLAAVVALIHDVLVTLGVIALSFYVAPYLGFLGIEGFKISLVVLAAFLTIIGYSLNDTIVVFDRIREVRGKAPNITGDMLNTSINQTLSRTLLTSLTTFIVVLVLYIGGGSGIHAFAFTLMVGVIVGTYSSIFIASPILLWLSKSETSKKR